MKNQKGFSLIELLIVIVVISIVAAIAIPNLLAAHRAANEGSAQASLRTMHGAQATYQSTTGSGNYGTLAQLGAVNLLDSQLGVSAAQKSGYSFKSFNTDRTTTGAATFTASGSPIINSGLSETGSKDFCIAIESVIRSRTATANITADGQCVNAAFGWTTGN